MLSPYADLVCRITSRVLCGGRRVKPGTEPVLVFSPLPDGLDFLFNEGRKEQVSVGCGPGEALGFIHGQLDQPPKRFRFMLELFQQASLMRIDPGGKRPTMGGGLDPGGPGANG